MKIALAEIIGMLLGAVCFVGGLTFLIVKLTELPAPQQNCNPLPAHYPAKGKGK